VRINDLVVGVNIALGLQPVTNCGAFANTEGKVTVSQLIQGVNNSLRGCPPADTPTATPSNTPGAPTMTPVVGTPTITPTPGGSCPLTPGVYTVTQLDGGTLQAYTFAPYAFPSGGTIVEDVKAASPPDCLHDVVIPFPGGFSAPNFCIPALMFTTSVTQRACGIGKIDSNGGGDFETTEAADTSDTSGTCNLPHAPCSNGLNAGIRVDVTIGDDMPDTCSGGATANALVSVPVHTVSWADTSGGTYLGCPGNGVLNPGDMVAAEFDQILDFTTDTATGKWMDLDGDGCTIAGFGPPAGFRQTGKCMDLSKINTGTLAVTTVATGEFGATGGLFDGTFTTKLPNAVDGPDAPLNATCDPAPVINFDGTATRCIP
jgi:hypothetical protein